MGTHDVKQTESKSEYLQLLSMGVQQSRHLSTKRNFKILCVFVLVYIFYYGYQVYDDRVFHLYGHDSYEAPCEIPEVNPFDPEMMKYVWRLDPLECHKKPTPVVYVDDDNILQFNESALSEQGETKSSIHCDYFNILRSQEPFKMDTLIDFSEPHPCNPPMDIKEDFFRVKCTGTRGKKVFDNTLTKIVKTKRTLGQVNPDEDKYNVMLFGIDSVSRASAIRQLPNTFKFLTHDLKSIDFKGHTKVGSTTYPNIIPLLTGYTADTGEIPKQDYMTQYLNGYPFIWNNFSDSGYATMFAEDLPNLGAFNLDKIGFKEYPTDHYMRPYWLGNFKLTPMHNLVTHVQRALQESSIKVAPSALCNGNVPNHVTLTNYLKQFMLTYRKEKKFVYSFLTELAHSHQNFLNFGDNDIRDFFKWMKVYGFMDDTILIIFGDHGITFGQNQHLFAARLESRLPLLQIVLPDKLTAKYPKLLKNMRTNENRLSSHFDLHATLRDILNSNFEKPTSFKVGGSVRGISLFQELSKDRSCKDANIGPSFCACYKSEPVNVTNNPDVRKMALKSVQHINNLLSESPECVKLELNFTDSARKVLQGLKYHGVLRRHNLWFNFHVPEAEVRDDTKYVLVFTTTPGGGKFYATSSINKETGAATILGNVDRINRYGKQSHCVHTDQLRPFCLCKDMVGNENYKR